MDNYFSGTFPGFGAVNLFTLNLGKNQFSGTFPSPCTSSYLSHIEIQGNQFGDALPDLSCLNELWFLDASRNKFDSAVSLDWIASGRYGLAQPFPNPGRLFSHTRPAKGRLLPLPIGEPVAT